MLIQHLLGSAIVFGLAISPAFGAFATREELLKGAWVPERREFPTNSKVSPCKDLYEYACSKVTSSFRLRDDRSSHTFSFNDSHERLLHARTQFLEKLTSSKVQEKDLSERSQTLRNVFLACMSEKDGARQEREFVTSQLKEIDEQKSREDFQKFLGKRIDTPDMSFVSFDSIPNQDNPMRNDLILGTRLMTLPERSYYAKPEVTADLEKLMIAFFETIKLSDPEGRAKRVMAFEKQFAQVYPLPHEIRERFAQRNYVERSSWTENYPQLAIDHFLKRIPGEVKFRNLLPETFGHVEKQMKEADLETLKDVLRFLSLKGVLDDAYPEFFKKRFEFNRKHLGGPDKRPVRKERCTRLVMSDFGREIDAELLPILFPDFPEKKVIELGEKVRKAIVDSIEENTWLSAEGKSNAKKKISGATLLLVKPGTDDEWDFNPPGKYTKNEPITNSRTLQKLRIDKDIKELSEDRNRRRWLMSPLEINAYYMPMDNVFVLPIGILQYPFFDPNLPEHVNIAAIGSVVGHELGHSIDDKGSKYDAEGRLKPWMSEQDLKAFTERGQKFVDRFEKIGHNGKLTLGENIGDHVGISSAYRAAFPNETDVGVPVEKKKEFFTQYARSWCQVMRPKYREMRLKTDPHAMGEARVNEQVKNLAGFHDAFSCKKGDPLYLPPEERIKVW
jgi:putative endopeptidase